MNVTTKEVANLVADIKVGIYIKSLELARKNKQVIGPKSDNYITLEQLHNILGNESL